MTASSNKYIEGKFSTVTEYNDSRKSEYLKYDGMSTAALKDLLYRDSLMSAEETADIDAVMYISQLLTEREAASGDFDPGDAKESWNEFLNRYAESVDEESLYGETAENDVITADSPKTEKTQTGEKTVHFPAPKKYRTRFIAAVVAAIVLYSLLSVAASAFGGDFWDVFGWTIIG